MLYILIDTQELSDEQPIMRHLNSITNAIQRMIQRPMKSCISYTQTLWKVIKTGAKTSAKHTQKNAGSCLI